MRLLRPFIAAAFAGSLVAGCATGTGGPARADIQQERQQSQAVLQELRQKDLLVKGGKINGYVNQVAARIDRGRPKNAAPLKLFIIRDPEANAFTTGAGYIFIHAGLLALMENEAQFAMVMAHEAAHIDRGHVTAGMERQQTTGLLAAIASIAGAAAGLPGDLVNLGVGLTAQAYIADFSREQETEADVVGLNYMKASGYNGVEGAKSFAVLRRVYGDNASIFSSHPRSSDRQSDLVERARSMGATDGRVAQQEFLQKTMPIRRQALKFYEKNNRTAQVQQVRRNLKAAR